MTKTTIVTFKTPIIHPSGFHFLATLNTRFTNVFLLIYNRLGSNQTSSVCKTRWLLPGSTHIAATHIIVIIIINIIADIMQR